MCPAQGQARENWKKKRLKESCWAWWPDVTGDLWWKVSYLSRFKLLKSQELARGKTQNHSKNVIPPSTHHGVLILLLISAGRIRIPLHLFLDDPFCVVSLVFLVLLRDPRLKLSQLGGTAPVGWIGSTGSACPRQLVLYRPTTWWGVGPGNKRGVDSIFYNPFI